MADQQWSALQDKGVIRTMKIEQRDLVENAITVFGTIDLQLGAFTDYKKEYDTHKAILTNIEKIDQSKCDHWGVFSWNKYVYKCAKCSSILIPSGWREVE